MKAEKCPLCSQESKAATEIRAPGDGDTEFYGMTFLKNNGDARATVRQLIKDARNFIIGSTISTTEPKELLNRLDKEINQLSA